jgi:hypothetical protein
VTEVPPQGETWNDPPPGEAPKVLTFDEYLQSQEFRLRDQNAAAERELRKFAAGVIIKVFAVVNIVILIAVAVAATADYYFIYQKALIAKERLIDNRVIMSLVGATTVQLGAIMVTIYGYIFPRGNRVTDPPASTSRPSASSGANRNNRTR